MGKIASDILETVGGTPMVRINRLNTGAAEIVAKMESFNPGGSAKDRIAVEMIRRAEADGRLAPGGCVIEPTSGNTGVGLAMVCAVRGYRLILTMPETMSLERRRLLAAYGAELVLTDGASGMTGAIERAREILAATPGAFMPRQIENPANPEAHYSSTAMEIWEDCGGRVDVFVAGVGTGGTFTGTVRRLKELNPELIAAAVEPDTSAVLSGGRPGAHKLQGIGAGFIPGVMDTALADRIIPVSGEDAYRCTAEAAAREGLLIGISGGAALFAALRLAGEAGFAGKRIVVLLPDTGERYLSSGVFDA